MNKLLLKSKLGIVAALLLPTSAYAQDNAVQTYLSYVRQAFFEIFTTLRSLNNSVKLAILAGLVFIAIIIYLRTKDTMSNNMRRARGLHKRALELHEQGKDEESAKLYQKANTYREKGEGQA